MILYKDRKEKKLTHEEFNLWKLRRNERNRRQKSIRKINEQQTRFEEGKQMVTNFMRNT